MQAKDARSRPCSGMRQCRARKLSAGWSTEIKADQKLNVRRRRRSKMAASELGQQLVWWGSLRLAPIKDYRKADQQQIYTCARFFFSSDLSHECQEFGEPLLTTRNTWLELSTTEHAYYFPKCLGRAISPGLWRLISSFPVFYLFSTCLCARVVFCKAINFVKTDDFCSWEKSSRVCPQNKFKHVSNSHVCLLRV